MDKEIKTKLEVLNKNEEENKAEEMHRLTITKQAEMALVNLLERINEGFVGGRVLKSEVASWALIRFEQLLSDSMIREIRSEHFDEVAMLEHMLRQAKETGQVPADLRELLQRKVGVDAVTKKTSKKAPKSTTKPTKSVEVLS